MRISADDYSLTVLSSSNHRQGFFNALIFIRPKYIRWRRRHPDKSRWQCLREALKPRGSTPGADAVPSPPQEHPRLVASVLPVAVSSAKQDSTNVSALLSLEDDNGVSVDTVDSSGSSSTKARNKDEKTDAHIQHSLEKVDEATPRTHDSAYSAARLLVDDTNNLPLDGSIV